MITVKVIIEDSNVEVIVVNREYSGALTGKSLDEIESLVCEIKRETIEVSELSLLRLNQKEATKRNRITM